MRNTLASQKPSIPSDVPPGYESNWTFGRVFAGSIEHFVGGTFSPDYSPLGAFVVGAGGGNSWWGNNVSIGDLSSLTFSVILPPSPYSLSDTYPNTFKRCDRNWLDYPDQSPATTHRYTAIQHMPASWGTSGKKGAFMYFGGQHLQRMWSHMCDLASPAWQRHSNSSLSHTGLALYPATTRDDARQCFYAAQAAQSGNNKHWKITKGGVITEHRGGIGVSATVSCMGYAQPPYDLVVSVGNSTGGIAIRSAASDTWTNNSLKSSGTRPTYGDPNGLHPEWDPDRNCFVFWDPLLLKIHKLHPPAGDPMSGEWAWEDEQITASVAFPPMTPPKKASGGQWSKLRRIPALKAFVYPASLTELQIIRPKGA
jgi:hypothetical protein